MELTTPAPAIPVPEKPATSLGEKDSAFAAAMLVCGFLFFNLILFTAQPAAGTTVFALLTVAVTCIYLTKSGFKQTPKSLISLALTIVASLHLLIFDNGLLFFLTFVFAAMLYVYWVMTTTGRSIDEKLTSSFIGDVAQQGFVVPFTNFGTGIAALAHRFKQGRFTGVVLGIVGILLFLPLLAAVVSLLVSADLAFETFLTGATASLNLDDVMRYLWQLVLGIPVALYLFGLVYGNVTGRHTTTITKDSLALTTRLIRIAPHVMIYAALAAFCLIYTLFFVVQGGYLFSGFTEKLPEAYTYAEYARRGFFELCAVAGINLVVLSIAHLLTRRELEEQPRELRFFTALISVFTLLLIATALSKMVLYIATYALTPLRVYTSWFMVLLAFIFVIVLVRQFVRFNAARLIIVGFVVLFFALSFGNVDGMIARYNIGVYEAALQAGEYERIDIEAFAELSDGAADPLYAWYQRLDERDVTQAELRQRIEEALMSRYSWDQNLIEDGLARSSALPANFRSFSLQRMRANQIRLELLEAGVAMPDYFVVDE